MEYGSRSRLLASFGTDIIIECDSETSQTGMRHRERGERYASRPIHYQQPCLPVGAYHSLLPNAVKYGPPEWTTGNQQLITKKLHTFARILSRDVVAAAHGAFSQLTNSSLVDTHAIITHLTTTSSADPSLTFRVDRSHVIPRQYLEAALDEVELPKVHRDKVMSNINAAISQPTGHEGTAEEKMATRGLIIYITEFTIFPASFTTISSVDEQKMPSIFTGKDKDYHRRNYLGMNADSDNWERELREISRISAVRIKEGVEPGMTEREWARWCRSVSHPYFLTAGRFVYSAFSVLVHREFERGEGGEALLWFG